LAKVLDGHGFVLSRIEDFNAHAQGFGLDFSGVDWQYCRASNNL
jgi:hypothetical protein